MSVRSRFSLFCGRSLSVCQRENCPSDEFVANELCCFKANISWQACTVVALSLLYLERSSGRPCILRRRRRETADIGEVFVLSKSVQFVFSSSSTALEHRTLQLVARLIWLLPLPRYLYECTPTCLQLRAVMLESFLWYIRRFRKGNGPTSTAPHLLLER